MTRPGRHFLQIPGPTNTPDRILRAMAAPTIDHRGPEFAELGREDLEILCERDDEFSPVVTTVVMPGHDDADRFRAIVLDRFNMSLGAGLGRLKGRTFRIGHLGDFNALMLIGTLGGVELGLAAAGVPFTRGGVGAALAMLSQGAAVESTAGVSGR